ncbi:folate-binding protein [Tropicimonas sp. IMCC6043]|nr:folate-binding protein YgfZ [Tropicimonas sp. IMCC6043]RYH11865.1 folate-binding protein [Tropicimonas sp. IMCC6043]
MIGRRILAISGADRTTFLQGLVTNDLARLSEGLVYAALLSPQGKYLADFFLLEDGDRILLDTAEPLADGLLKRLSMYRLRADVTIAETGLQVARGIGAAPDGAHADPRDPAMGWRLYGDDLPESPEVDWDALRVAHCVPEAGIELQPDDAYILEYGFERLNGVDFRKGCYVGQEVTARMKHKTELKKGLVTVAIEGTAPIGSEILAEGRPAGKLFTQSGDRALAYLRFDRAGVPLEAGEARVTWPI